MNYKQATLNQLNIIAYYDQEAYITDKQQAKAEIARRQKKRYTRINYKRKEA